MAVQFPWLTLEEALQKSLLSEEEKEYTPFSLDRNEWDVR